MATGLLLINSSGASNSGRFTVTLLNGERASIMVEGLAGAETVDLETTTDDFATVFDVFLDGSQVRATTTNNIITIATPGQYSLDVAAAAGTIRANFVRNQDLF